MGEGEHLAHVSELGLSEGPRHLCPLKHVVQASAAPVEDCLPETLQELLPGATERGGVVWGEHKTKHLEPGEGRVLPASPGTNKHNLGPAASAEDGARLALKLPHLLLKLQYVLDLVPTKVSSSAKASST